MKRFIILPLLLSFLLIGCSEQVINNSTSQNQADAVSELVMVTSPIEYTTKGCYTEEGYYYIDYNDTAGIEASIRYVDYANLLDLPLTSQITGVQDETNESYIGSSIGGCIVFTIGDHLYYLRCGSSYYYNTYGEAALPAIYSMNLDGSDRKLLVQGKSNEEFKTALASDGTWIYFVTSEYEKDKTGEIQYLTKLNRINIETGNREQVAELLENEHIIGAFSDNIILQRIYPIEQKNQEIPAYYTDISIYNLSSKDYIVFDTWDTNQTMIFTSVYGDCLFKFDLSTREITLKSFIKSNTRTFSASDMFSENNTNIWFPCFYDGYFFCLDDDSNGTWAIDLNTGEKSLRELTYYNNNKMQEEPIEIFAQNKDYYLVSVGQDVATTFPIYNYALIDKKDYMSGNPVFQNINKIEDIS